MTAVGGYAGTDVSGPDNRAGGQKGDLWIKSLGSRGLGGGL